jgi:hypothetical protein
MLTLTENHDFDSYGNLRYALDALDQPWYCCADIAKFLSKSDVALDEVFGAVPKKYLAVAQNPNPDEPTEALVIHRKGFRGFLSGSIEALSDRKDFSSWKYHFYVSQLFWDCPRDDFFDNAPTKKIAIKRKYLRYIMELMPREVYSETRPGQPNPESRIQI